MRVRTAAAKDMATTPATTDSAPPAVQEGERSGGREAGSKRNSEQQDGNDYSISPVSSLGSEFLVLRDEELLGEHPLVC